MSEVAEVRNHIAQARSMAAELVDTTSPEWDAMMRTEINRLDADDRTFDLARDYLKGEVEDKLQQPLKAQMEPYEAVHQQVCLASQLLTPAARKFGRSRPLHEQYMAAMVKDTRKMVGAAALEYTQAQVLINGLEHPEALHKRRTDQIERLRIAAHHGLKANGNKGLYKVLFKVSADQFLELY